MRHLRLQPEPPEHFVPKAQAQWWAAQAVEQALQKLKDIYLEFGWD